VHNRGPGAHIPQLRGSRRSQRRHWSEEPAREGPSQAKKFKPASLSPPDDANVETNKRMHVHLRKLPHTSAKCNGQLQPTMSAQMNALDANARV